MNVRNAFLAGAACLACGLASQTASAQQSVEAFYKGKQIEFIIGYTPGGGYDTYARIVAKHMTQFIPGNPNIVARNMPGGGSRVAANFVYRVAPKDGTVLATADQSLSLQQAVGDKTIQFDTTKFNYIGNPSAENNVTAVWHTSGIKTIQEAMTQEVPMGATGGSTSSQYPKAMNALLGTKFKIILGYPGGNDINLAMEKGEVAGRGSNSWASYKATRPDWLRDKKINILVQIGLTKAPDLPDVPLLIDLAKNDADRAVLRMLSAPATIGRPIFTTPDVPAERIKALRDAFDKTMKDPGFLDDAKKAALELDPVSGEELQKIVNEIIATPKETADRLSAIIGELK
ncbi:MAG: tripartite tricarboxylate transporter substrate-binding protein [Beijerinckiaceae bacterium]|nr:tripartite tricarboxylate transporter substrate-binding protein [Beijerinckiaceae bacterium]